MKKIFSLAMMMTIAISANAMSYSEAKNEALFLSDKMAFELNLTNDQYDAVYEINLDYLMSVNSRNDIFGTWWDRRNLDLQFVLTAYQYNKYLELSYFYRPLSWNAGRFTLNVYSHYTNRNHFYKARPTVFTSYRGGNNRKANHYAGRNGSGSTWRITGNNNGNGSSWRNTGNNSGGNSNGRNAGRGNNPPNNGHGGSNSHQPSHNAHGSFAGNR